MTNESSEEHDQRAMQMEINAPDNVNEKTGLAFWMERVMQECVLAAPDFAPEPVHDLRVALRRCRSIAEGFAVFDPDRSWNDMRREAGSLFRKLGNLRDAQVMIEWLKKPIAPQDESARIVIDHLNILEMNLKEAALEALNNFDKKKWTAWSMRLSKRAARIPLQTLAFQHLALERWYEAHALHRQALRNRSHVGFHRLRIGLKRLRYIVENYLPSLHVDWGSALRELQDLLGEMHDLHVLLQLAMEVGAIRNKETRDRWRSWIDEECRLRLNRYRQKMTGRDSLWRIWRAGLPEGDQLESAVMERLQTWASFRDADCARSRHLADLALQLYDGLAGLNLLGTAASGRARAILHASALMHDVGSSAHGKKRPKESYRVISRLPVPIGWEPDDLKIASLAVRYHRGALPAPDRKSMQGLSMEQQQIVRVLSGVLRLAMALGSSRQRKISQLLVRKPGETLVVIADGYREYDPLAQKLARARYLLEIAVGLPVIIRGA
jgi:CHAD domain-containing protein